MADKPVPDPAKITELKRRLAREPASRSFLELAREYHEAGQLEEASVVCAQGLKYHPGYLSARVLLGRIYFDMGRVDDSRSQLESVLAQAPDNLIARKVLAEICLEQGDAAGALERLRALLAFNPADAETRRKIAEVEASLAAPPSAPPPEAAPPASATTAERAEPDLVEVLEPPEEAPVEPPAAAARGDGAGGVPAEVDPGVLATPTLAEIYLQQGLLEKAAVVYREILRGDPYNEEARARLSDLDRRAAERPSDPAAGARARKIQALRSWLGRIREGDRAVGRAGGQSA